MKKLFLICMVMFVFGLQSIKAQNSFEDIVKGCQLVVDTKDFNPKQVIRYKMENEEMKELTFWNLQAIYDLDVISYFRLQGYDTDLQKELYKETDEYKEYLKKLTFIKDSIKNTKYYYIRKLKSNYDLSKSAFAYGVELYEGSYVKFPGYINHRTLCIEYATKRFPNNKIEINKIFGGRDYFYNQKIYLTVKDKQTALRIEQAGKNKAVLFVFKISSIKSKKTLFFTEEFALTRTEAIYIINKETGEVYCKVL